MDIRLHLNKLDRRSVQQLKDLGFQSKSGEEIPLSAFASLQITGGLKTVLRRDGKLVLSCQVFAKEEDLDSLYGEIDRAMEGFKMPPGYSWDKGDRYDKFRESEEAMQFAVLLAITFVFLLMGVLFESLILPFSVLFCIPFAFLGVYWTLFLTETVMDRMAQVGIIVLIGVVVNNAIVLVDMVNRLPCRGQGSDGGDPGGGHEPVSSDLDDHLYDGVRAGADVAYVEYTDGRALFLDGAGDGGGTAVCDVSDAVRRAALLHLPG